MARTLTLQPATTDPFDSGWVGKIATAWTGASLQLTVVGSGRRLIQLERQIAGTTLQLFSQDVEWSEDEVLTFPLGDFTGQVRLTGGLAIESATSSIQVEIVCSGDILPWDSSLALDYRGTPEYPAPGSTARNANGSTSSAGPISAPGLDARPIRAVVIGDSHHALLGPTVTTGQRTSQMASYLWWMLHALDWSVPVVANLAVGGRRTDQIAATVDAALALRPDIVFESSITNDLLQNYRWSAQRAGKEAYCDRIVQSGAALVLFIAPCASTAADDIQDTIQHRQWAYNFAATRRNVWIIDGLAATVDPASATLSAKSGMLPDNVHLSMVAARAVGEIAAQLGIFATLRGAQLPPFSPYETTAKDPDCVQLYDNPGLTGSVALSGDGVSGVGPTAWNVSRGGSAGTFVGSLVTADGWTDFVATMADCVNGTNFQRQINPPAPLLAALVGKTVVFEWEQEYTGVSGVAEDFFQLYTPAVSKGACVAVDLGIIAVSQLIPQGDGVRRYRSGPIEIPAGTTVLRLNWRTYWLSAGGGTIKFRKLRMWDASKLAVVSLG